MKHYYRPSMKSVAEKHADRFPKISLFTIGEMFGGWEKVQKIHFEDGGTFDQIYKPGKQAE